MSDPVLVRARWSPYGRSTESKPWFVRQVALVLMLPWFSAHVLGAGAEGKVTPPGRTHASEWPLLGGMAVGAVGLFALARAIERRRAARPLAAPASA
jgi:hypothetical protein